MGIVRTIIEFSRQVINFVISFVTDRVEVWRERRRYHERVREYMEQVLQQDAQYQPEPPDVEAALRSKAYLDDIFPNGISEKVSQMTDDELLELFKDIEKNAESILGVSVDNVDFYTSDDFPVSSYFGYYSHESNSLHINAAYILSGKPELIQEQIYTIFHELKHARQWAAVLDGVDYGYSDELLRSWAENMQTYIPPYESDEAYRKQPLELDTFGFESILKGEREV